MVMDRTATFRIRHALFTEQIVFPELIGLPFVDGWLIGVILPRFVVIFELALDFDD